MDDLKERLESCAEDYWGELALEAADRIEALEAKVKDAVDGLRKIAVGKRVDYSRIDFTYEPLDEDEAREIATATLAKLQEPSQ